MLRSAQLVIAVLVTCVVAASGLAATYGLTKDRIAEQERLAEERSLAAVAPQAESFALLEDARVIESAAGAAAPVDLRAIYVVEDASGQPSGWAVKVASRGYGGPMQVVIGLDRSGEVTGVTILTMNETPGLGTKVVTEPWFMPQFTTLPPGFDDADVRGLDVIGGATKSCNGVRNAVAAAGRMYAQVLSAEGGSQ